MSPQDTELAVIPAGTRFAPGDITFYFDQANRSLEQSLEEADLLVSCPHSGSALPEELARFLVPGYFRRKQFDFTDLTTGPIVRRWAELDRRIIYVENPHPRLVRDPNRARPDDVERTLREAFERVETAGYGNACSLDGVDAIRPVTFAFEAVVQKPQDDRGWAELVDTFTEVGSRGLDVYQRTREDLLEQMVQLSFNRPTDDLRPRRLTTLSFHDTMNHTMGAGGAVNVERAPKDRLPAVVALSNRGDSEGEAGEGGRVTMGPARLRQLAAAHRTGFDVAAPGDVALNSPYLGSQEIIAAGARFAELQSEADSRRIALDAVQAEFLREYLIGPAGTAQLMRPGLDWPATDPQQVDRIARRCMRSWDLYRAS